MVDKEFKVYSWILIQKIGRTFGTGCKKKPLMANLLRHLSTRKVGYKLFKAGYSRQFMVKPNVKKDEAVHFLVRCYVNAEMKKKQYLVYVHLHQHSGDVTYAKCYCPAGAGGCCKHVAATLYQLLDYIELGLSDIPDDTTCTQELQKWHVPRKNTTQTALLSRT